MNQDSSTVGTGLTLDQVRARLDVIDTEMLRLVDERAALAGHVAAAKRAAGAGDQFGLRAAREAQIMRRLLATPRQGASDALTVRLWRELIGDSLAQQGPFQLFLYGGEDPARMAELARFRFGSAPPMSQLGHPDEAIMAARKPGGVAILPLQSERAWWGRLLAEPNVKIFAALPCLSSMGPVAGVAAGNVAVEPTGADQTFWVTDAPRLASAVEEALSRDGVAATLLADVGGLKLFSLAGYYQPDDERLARAPGRLTGVVGAAPLPFDV